MKNTSAKLLLSFLLLSVLVLLAAFPALADTAIDEASFPDAAFREFVEGFDKNRDGVLSDSEIKAVKSMDCSGRRIRDLTGIQVFTSLKTLNAGDNILTGLDVSGCAELQELICKNNPLLELNVTGAAKLEHLDCESTYLTELDLSGNPVLNDLCVTNMSSLTGLSLAHNPKMQKLWTLGSGLTTVNIGSCPELVTVYGRERTAFGDGYMYSDNNWKHVLVINGNAAVNTAAERVAIKATSIDQFAGSWELYSMTTDGVTLSKDRLKTQDGKPLITCVIEGETLVFSSNGKSAYTSITLEADGTLRAVSYDGSVNYFILYEDGTMSTCSNGNTDKTEVVFTRAK